MSAGRSPAQIVRRYLVLVLWALRPRFPRAVSVALARVIAQGRRASRRHLAGARQEMQHLLRATGTEAEIEAAARDYIDFVALCDQLRWSPSTLRHQRVKGAHHLEAAHARGRGIALSFVHHGHFDGMFASVAQLGVPVHVVTAPELFEPRSPRLAQHVRIVGSGGSCVSAALGQQGMVDKMAQGEILASAIDVPGQSTSVMGGRPVRCSSGLVRAAITAGAPILPITTERDDDGAYLQLHEPIDPAAHDSPDDVLQLLVRLHESAVMAWPAAAYLPTLCWGDVEG